MVGNELQLIDVHFNRYHDHAFNRNEVIMDAISNPLDHTCPLIKLFNVIQIMF